MKELGIDAEIEKIEDLIEIVKLGVLSAPSLMVDGEILVSGQTTSVKRIKKLLQNTACKPVLESAEHIEGAGEMDEKELRLFLKHFVMKIV